jgi:ribosomal-protein-alanine N-acetyltransferase
VIFVNSDQNNDIDQFQTARLRAERLLPHHLADLSMMHRDPRVMRTLGGVRSDAKTQEYLAVNLDHWKRHGYGLWIVRDVDETFVGRAGIRHLAIETKNEIELAYSVMPGFWARGLATEIAKALLKIAFERLDIPELVAFTLSDNQASRKVMEKVGFQYERAFTFEALPCVLYRINVKPGLP